MSSPFVEDTLDRLIFQVFYRGLGIVSVHEPMSRVFPAAQDLSLTRRGGTVEWVVPGRVAVWFDLVVEPSISDSPMLSMWMIRSAVGDKNVALVRVGWWADYTLPNIPLATNLENTFKNRLRVGPVFRLLGAGPPQS